VRKCKYPLDESYVTRPCIVIDGEKKKSTITVSDIFSVTQSMLYVGCGDIVQKFILRESDTNDEKTLVLDVVIE
jgi:hypothetical protein